MQIKPQLESQPCTNWRLGRVSRVALRLMSLGELLKAPASNPVRPLALVGDLGDAAPGEARLADSDGIAQRLAVAEHEVESALAVLTTIVPGF